MMVNIKGVEYKSGTIELIPKSRTVKLDFGLKFRLGKVEFENVLDRLNIKK